MNRVSFHRTRTVKYGVASIFLLLVMSLFPHQRAWVKHSIDSALVTLRSAYQDAFTALGYYSFASDKDSEISDPEKNTLAGMLIKQNILEEENKNLKQLLSFKERSSHKLLNASVIGKTTDFSRSMLILDRGVRDGVLKDFAVVAYDGVLIGKIADAKFESSFVRLLHDPKSKTIASYRSNDKIVQGLITGKFHTGIELSLVPITEPIAKSLPVATSGTEEFIPAGLLIGFISNAHSLPSDLFYSISIAPAVLPSSLGIVGIIIPADLSRDGD